MKSLEQQRLAVAVASSGCLVKLWSTYKKLLIIAIEIVDLPIKNADFP